MKNVQVQDAQSQCVECGEGITNPICPDCLAAQMASWQPEIGKKLARPETYSEDLYVGEGVKCMFCGRTMSICAHCYSRDVYDIVSEQYPELAEDFIDIFNFNLREEML